MIYAEMIFKVYENIFILGLILILFFYSETFDAYFYHFCSWPKLSVCTVSILLTKILTFCQINSYFWTTVIIVVNILYLIKLFNFKSACVLHNLTQIKKKSFSPHNAWTWLSPPYIIIVTIPNDFWNQSMVCQEILFCFCIVCCKNQMRFL